VLKHFVGWNKPIVPFRFLTNTQGSTCFWSIPMKWWVCVLGKGRMCFIFVRIASFSINSGFWCVFLIFLKFLLKFICILKLLHFTTRCCWSKKREFERVGDTSWWVMIEHKNRRIIGFSFTVSDWANKGFFIFFCSTEVWTQGFTLARQDSAAWAIPLTLFALVILEIGSCFLLRPAWTSIFLFYASCHCWDDSFSFSIEIGSHNVFCRGWPWILISDTWIVWNDSSAPPCPATGWDTGCFKAFSCTVLEPPSSRSQFPKCLRLQAWATLSGWEWRILVSCFPHLPAPLQTQGNFLTS
jgi:hypothetical protein